MKISYNWLSDFVTWKEKDPAIIADRLTASVGEVEEVIVQGEHLKGCCVGKILSLSKHPNADRLSLCEVKTDQGTKKVVCGGSNLRSGMRVAFAHVGARVRWHGTEMVTLEKTKIRGEESEGMICAASELELSSRFPLLPGQDDHTIIDLGDGDEDIGTSLTDHLELTDVVFHIDNHAITHRPDLFSHIGFARECVALGLAIWKKEKKTKPQTFPKNPPPFTFVLTEKKLVPRYCACTLSVAGLGETPLWMKQRLEATGWRSINLPIDITNYVFMETGMPLHSFDASDIHGTVRMRTATEGESITTLDEVQRKLCPGALIMEDDQGIFDLLGIMGGLRGSTKETTRSIWLHSAIVDPANTRRTVIAMGHRTDAATVYEKDVPPVMAKIGFLRALELFLTLMPEAALTSKLIEWGTDGKSKPIPFSHKDAEKHLGMPVSDATVKKVLTDLGFKVTKTAVTAPLWRINDIEGSHDIVEEVGRIVGFDRITPVLPDATIAPPPRDKRLHAFRDDLKEEGFLEIVPISLVSPQLISACKMDPNEAYSILNPIGEELSLMQTSVLPRLLEHAGKNLLQADQTLKTFTCTHVFNRREGEWMECGIFMANRKETSLVMNPFLKIRQLLVDEFSGVGSTVAINASEKVPPFGHAGRSADLLIDGKTVGILCELHPDVNKAFDLPARSAVALLDVTTLLELPKKPAIFSPIAEFPAITYDLTVTLDSSKSAEKLISKIRGSSPLLTSVIAADLYDGKPLESGKYNLTLRCTYQAKDRTLTEEEVKKEHERVEKLVMA
ncbi:MAG: phenylalanine--tRNA ligase subunit beta [Candidatus Peregrinibacteria bacterium]